VARALTWVGPASAILLVVTACSSSPGSSAHPGDQPDAATGGGDDAQSTSGGDGGSMSEAESGSSAVASRFVTGIVTFTPTDCAGFGSQDKPGIVEGPPVGGGTTHGSIDVLSFGSGGSIVVSFAPNAIVDGPGDDFIVFENPFWIGGDSSRVYAEPGEVSVSDDGTTWHTFPCNPTFDPGASDGTGTAPPYGACAGWRVVYSTPQNGISPFDSTVSGGDPFDLAQVGLKHARYVRIVDRTDEVCPEAGASKPDTNGFDLDAVAIVHAELP
jgi:hypothetical protein